MIPSVVVIGIPESGKSSFIAALSHILEFREIETVLTLAQLPDEAQYLFEMRNEWQGCQPFERTKVGGFHPIVFNLEDRENHRIDLSFPDIAGEEFEEQWSTRVWNERYLEAIEQASGVLLFVNAKNLRKPFSLADADKVKRSVLALLDGEENTDDQNDITHEAVNSGEAIARQVSSQAIEAEEGESNPAAWEPRKADEQAKLVDILQSLVDFAPDRRWRLGIVVSAWDLVHKADAKTKPRAWIEKHMPLMRQYLQSNAPSFEFEAFGVSAQGGDPASEAERLQKFDSQSERVLVVSDDYEGHDLTRVVAWVTSGDA
jgi:Double-GTPase 1